MHSGEPLTSRHSAFTPQNDGVQPVFVGSTTEGSTVKRKQNLFFNNDLIRCFQLFVMLNG